MSVLWEKAELQKNSSIFRRIPRHGRITAERDKFWYKLESTPPYHPSSVTQWEL